MFYLVVVVALVVKQEEVALEFQPQQKHEEKG